MALAAAALLAACEGGTEPAAAGPPATIQVVSGGAQTGTVGQELPEPLVVRVVDAGGTAVPEQLVDFVVTAGGGRVQAGAAITNAAGEARDRWTLGTSTADSQRVEVRALDAATGIALVATTIAATPRAGAPTSVTIAPIPAPVFLRDTVAVAATVTDAYGNRVPGTNVSWSITAGGGSITAATTAADSAGVARSAWVMGPQAGQNTLRAAAGNAVATADVSAQPRPAPARPTGVTATADQVAGSITLRWTPVPGAQGYHVYWSTEAGVTPATGTRVAGVSMPWVHADRPPGVQHHYVVTAFHADAESAPSLPVSATVPGPVTVIIDAPTAGALVGDTFEIRARVSAAVDLASVIASVDGRTTPLVFTNTGRFTGRIELEGLAGGSKILTVVATDLQGSVGQATMPLVLDRPPRVTLLEPLPSTVATPMLRVIATCEDDTGCVSLRVQLNSTTIRLAEGTTTIDQTVSLAAFEGDTVRVSAVAVDRSGQSRQSQPDRPVFVMTPPAGTVEVARTRGVVYDLDPTRILHGERISLGGRYTVLRMYDRGSASDSVLDTIIREVVESAFLTPGGAIFNRREWRDGVVSELRSAIDTTFRAQGRYVAWITELDEVMRRDIIAGTTVVVASGAEFRGVDVAANGDVVYGRQSEDWSGSLDTDVYRWRNGVSTRLNLDDAGDRWYRHGLPATDGSLVVYGRFFQITSNTPYAQIMLAGSTETAPTVIAEWFPESFIPTRDVYYRVENGWLAFLRSGAFGQAQVWTRSPAGELRQLTIFTSSSFLDTLAPDGTVVYSNPTLGKRWVAAPGGAPVEIPAFGRPVFRDGKLLLLLGRSVFEVSR